jgi:outer membrane protein OmpA-like peptidoglycan-associated protein
MAALTAQERQAQRELCVAKIEQAVTERDDLEGKARLLYFRVLLQDLPYDGAPSLLEDVHREAIEHLVQRAARFDLRILAIVGHSSAPGDDATNQDLALRRAQAVRDHLVQAVEASGLFADNSLVAGIVPEGRGESQPEVQTLAEADHPLNRRVEIAYRIRIDFPPLVPADGVPRSRHWKVDFSAGGGGFVVERGFGTLTMRPDEDTGVTTEDSRSLVYTSFGFSFGITAYLKKLKWVADYPRVQQLLKVLDPDLGGNYVRTEKFLKEIGFSVDFASHGGEFSTDQPRSFDEMAFFMTASLTGNLSLGGSAVGTAMLLHSERFFAWTIIAGVGMNIAVPDASIGLFPLTLVEVDV